MSDSVTQGQLKAFLNRNNFVSVGKRQVLYKGIFKGKACTVTFHYHKDNEVIKIGTLSAIAKQLQVKKSELIDAIKNR